jgi:hypothetical protein
LNVLTELRNRGVRDVYLFCVDGLKGFPQAIEPIYPPSAGAALHRAHGASEPELCDVAGSQESGGRSEADLPGGDCGRSGEAIERIRSPVQREFKFVCDRAVLIAQ